MRSSRELLAKIRQFAALHLIASLQRTPREFDVDILVLRGTGYRKVLQCVGFGIPVVVQCGLAGLVGIIAYSRPSRRKLSQRDPAMMT